MNPHNTKIAHEIVILWKCSPDKTLLATVESVEVVSKEMVFLLLSSVIIYIEELLKVNCEYLDVFLWCESWILDYLIIHNNKSENQFVTAVFLVVVLNDNLRKKWPYLAKKTVLFHQDNVRGETCLAIFYRFSP